MKTLTAQGARDIVSRYLEGIRAQDKDALGAFYDEACRVHFPYHIKDETVMAFLQAYVLAGPVGLGRVASPDLRPWDELLPILEEVVGLRPLTAFARERTKWTDHWVRLHQRPNLPREEKVKIRRLAKRRYPDFDMSLFK
jgi:hypothetical protein